MKKIMPTILLSLFLVGSFFVTANADNGQSVWLSYKNYSIPGSVDGSANGQFYSLTTGGVSLEVTDTTSSSGSMSMTLRRSRFGVDQEYGTKSIRGTGNYQWTIDTDSSDYYLFAWGGASGTTQTLSGKMHDHK